MPPVQVRIRIYSARVRKAPRGTAAWRNFFRGPKLQMVNDKRLDVKTNSNPTLSLSRPIRTRRNQDNFPNSNWRQQFDRRSRRGAGQPPPLPSWRRSRPSAFTTRLRHQSGRRGRRPSVGPPTPRRTARRSETGSAWATRHSSWRWSTTSPHPSMETRSSSAVERCERRMLVAPPQHSSTQLLSSNKARFACRSPPPHRFSATD